MTMRKGPNSSVGVAVSEQLDRDLPAFGTDQFQLWFGALQPGDSALASRTHRWCSSVSHLAHHLVGVDAGAYERRRRQYQAACQFPPRTQAL